MVTVDVIFHKCKPTGGRRFAMKEFLAALVAASDESKINVFERVGVLGGQLKPNKVFVAPQVRPSVKLAGPKVACNAGVDFAKVAMH